MQKVHFGCLVPEAKKRRRINRVWNISAIFTFQKKISLGSLEVKRTKNNQCVSIPYLTFGQLVLLNYPDDQTLIIMDVDFRDQEGTGDRSAKEEPPVLR